MIQYTHPFDLLFRIIVQIGIVYLGAIAASLLCLNILGLSPLDGLINNKAVSNVAFFLRLILTSGFFLAWRGILYNIVEEPLRTLPTWLYLRLFILAPASWQDAKELGFLVEYKTGRPWYHLREASQLPKTARIPAIKRFAQEVKVGRQQPPPIPPPQTQNPEREKLLWACTILGVGENASRQEITKAYRKMMKKHHPDKMSGHSQKEIKVAEARTKEINYAYEVLKKKE